MMPRSYAARFAQGLAGPSGTCIIAGAGPRAELDGPGEVAEAILAWTAA